MNLRDLRQHPLLYKLWFQISFSAILVVIILFSAVISLHAMGTIERLPWAKVEPQKTKINETKSAEQSTDSTQNTAENSQSTEAQAVENSTATQSQTATSTKNSTSGGSNNSSGSGSSGSGSSGGGGSGGSGSGGGSSSPTPTPTPSQSIFGKYSATSVESIVDALQLVYDDETGDFVNPPSGGRPIDQGGIFSYSPIDTDNMYMGIHGGRLYIKITLAGTIPSSRQTIGSDTVTSVVYNIGIDNDNDVWEDPASELNIQINIGYNSNGQIWYNPWFSANCTGEGEHNQTCTATGDGLAHTYNSGLGKSSIVFSYALSELDNTISVSSPLKVSISSEAESDTWHHYSYDADTSSNEPVWRDWTATEI